jgi:transketolase
MPYGPEDDLRVNTIRFLAADAVQKANSGHPGAPMGMAVMAYVLWSRFLRLNPVDPAWPDRDRFVLSAGHASMLLYALLHLTGHDLPLEELKRFRQWGSRTPGHPEAGLTPGVETTTGPLGQGFANAVGMAIAERWLAARFNRPGLAVVDHGTYAICSDGDLQEGISSEAASLAGALGLGRLVCLYDDNGIQIEGRVDRTMREDVRRRFEAYGWHVAGPLDGNDPEAVEAAIRAAREETARPSLVICRTHIAFGAPTKQDTAAAHGEPLGAEELAGARERLGWPYAEPFTVPPEVRRWAAETVRGGAEAQAAWRTTFRDWAAAHPALAEEWRLAQARELPAGWDEGLDALFAAGGKPLATRTASGKVLNALAAKVANLLGGSADLAPSTKTIIDGGAHFLPGGEVGRNLHFGVREHAMGAIANGMAYHGGLRPYTATFLVFSDYMRPAVRLSALAGLPVVHVFTHDSIGVGEDGPTHQPVEHLAALRAIPRYAVIRPADAAETAEAWRAALRRRGPTALVLTRQNLPLLDRTGTCAPAAGLQRGAYVLRGTKGRPSVILLASGSEVHLALAAFEELEKKDVAARVVSFPCWELFREQPQEYRDAVLPPAVTARVAVEAASPFGWAEWVGAGGVVIGLDRFGASAPAEILSRELGFTVERVVEAARTAIQANRANQKPTLP